MTSEPPVHDSGELVRHRSRLTRRWRCRPQQTLGLVFATALTTAAAQNPPALRATAESRISGDDQLLVPFNTLLVGPDGRIVVPQNQDGQLVFFDANGKRLGTFGHKGAGPGEFSLLDGTMGWRGGTLRVYDVNNGRRLTRIDSGHVAMHSRSTAARSFRTRTPTAGKRR